ncbi:hypothetical protein B7463_g9682, partial [Scytalidium lignicola]
MSQSKVSPKLSKSEKSHISNQPPSGGVNAVLKDVIALHGNPRALIMTVVTPEEEEEVKRLFKDSRKLTRSPSRIVVTTPERLQDDVNEIESEARSEVESDVESESESDVEPEDKTKYSTFHLLASPTVEYANILRIGSKSTFCGWNYPRWCMRPNAINNYKLDYSSGCAVDTTDGPEEGMRVLSHSRAEFSTSEENMDEIKEKCHELTKCMLKESEAATNRDTPKSLAEVSSPTPTPDKTETWFEKWKGLLAVIIGGGAGCAAGGGFMHFSAAGITIKGPFGLSMAAGYANCTLGGACAVGVGTAVVAGLLVYFIPWDQVFDFIRRQLSKIWNHVRDTITWIWKRLTALVGW